MFEKCTDMEEASMRQKKEINEREKEMVNREKRTHQRESRWLPENRVQMNSKWARGGSCGGLATTYRRRG